jgi:hypothetical protein
MCTTGPCPQLTLFESGGAGESKAWSATDFQDEVRSGDGWERPDCHRHDHEESRAVRISSDGLSGRFFSTVNGKYFPCG